MDIHIVKVEPQNPHEFEVYQYKVVFKSADSKHSNILEQKFKNSFGKMINSTKMQNLHDG